MGYEVPGAMGIKMAAPEREVLAIVGDGTWLMMCTDLITVLQEGVKLIVVVVDNHGYASIGGLSGAVGCEGFGTELRRRGPEGRLDGPILAVDYAAMAASMGAFAVRVRTIADLKNALLDARGRQGTSVIHVETDRYQGVGKYRSWWDIVPAEVSGSEGVRKARGAHEAARARQRCMQGENR
jgi:3D-(3,5/4)-trihydroxycyclohexane-1,2-dione acylhydrolase (decyclizing)